jgi:hypothetical protein
MAMMNNDSSRLKIWYQTNILESINYPNDDFSICIGFFLVRDL